MPAFHGVLAVGYTLIAFLFLTLVGMALRLPKWCLPLFMIAALIAGLWAGLAFAPVQRGGAVVVPATVGMGP